MLEDFQEKDKDTNSLSGIATVLEKWQTEMLFGNISEKSRRTHQEKKKNNNKRNTSKFLQQFMEKKD